MGETYDQTSITREDLSHLVPGISDVDIGDLLPPVLGPLQGLLALYPGQYRLGYRDEQGGYHTRWLSSAAVRRAVLHDTIDLGWLPAQTISCGIGEAGPWFIRFLPAARHLIQVQLPQRGITEITVPLPPLFFAGYGSDYYVWATKSTSTSWTPDTPLFHTPLPNVYSSGKICWGKNQPPPCRSSTLDRAWRLFISSPFNQDLATAKSRAHPKDVRLRLEELASRKRPPVHYPARDLLPLQRSLQQAVEYVIR